MSREFRGRSIIVGGLTVLLGLVSSTGGVASGPTCAPWDVGEKCRNSDLDACKVPLHGRINYLRDSHIPNLMAEKGTLPPRIQVCGAQERLIEKDFTRVTHEMGETQGKIAAHRTHCLRYEEIVTGLRRNSQQLSELAPIVIEAVPAIVSEIQAYLRNNELQLHSLIADLTDELVDEKDPQRRQVLRFRLRSLNDMRALKIHTSDFATLDQEVQKAMNPSRSAEEIQESWVSPLSMTLFESLRDGARSSIEGTQIFRRIESALFRSIQQVQSVLDQTRDAIVAENAKLPKLETEKQALEGAFHRKIQECDSLRYRRDKGVEAEIQSSQREIQRLDKQIDRCKEKFCTTCVTVIGF